jgi:glutathione S-transferase
MKWSARSPALDRSAVDAKQPVQLSHPRGRRALPHERDQHHHGGKIDLAPEEPQRRRRLNLPEVKAAIAARLFGAEGADADDLTMASIAAADLVRAGKLDEAEQAARDLLVRFPEVHDGYDRLGMVHEARGENRQTADCYRKVIEFIREHPDEYDPGFDDMFTKLVNGSTRQSPPDRGRSARAP